MTFEAALKQHLSSDATIAARVAERIFPLRLPEGTTKPAIVYGRVGARPQLDLSNTDGSLMFIKVQVDCWAAAHDAVQEIAEAVRLKMQAATLTANSFVIGDVFSQDIYDIDAKLYRVTTDFDCWYRTS